MADAERLDDVDVSLFIFSEKVVEQPATLVYERNQSASRREVLRVFLEVVREVGDALGDARNLVLRASRIGLVPAVCHPQLLDACGTDKSSRGDVLLPRLLVLHLGLRKQEVRRFVGGLSDIIHRRKRDTEAGARSDRTPRGGREGL